MAADVRRRRDADHTNANTSRLSRGPHATSARGVLTAIAAAGEQDVAATRDHARNALGRRLADAERDLRHRVELIDARDLRPRGWILATDMYGVPCARSARSGQARA